MLHVWLQPKTQAEVRSSHTAGHLEHSARDVMHLHSKGNVRLGRVLQHFMSCRCTLAPEELICLLASPITGFSILHQPQSC